MQYLKLMIKQRKKNLEVFTRLEDEGIYIQSTRIDRNKLKTVSGIKKLISEYQKEHS